MNSAEKRRLIEENYLDFFSFALAMLRNVDDAKDAVQEALVQVLTKRHVDNVLSYTYAAIRNQAIDTIRRRRKVLPLDDKVAERVDDQASRLELVGRLYEELPEALKALVELHDIEGYSIAELSIITNLSRSTLSRRLDEAHYTIKKQMEGKK